MKILITGGGGFLGRALAPFLASRQNHVFRLVRPEFARTENDILWNPENGELEWEKAAGADAVIHLAGEPLAGRWTQAKRDRIWVSRVHATHYLAHALARLRPAPRVLVTASAIGFYGERGEEDLTEASACGQGFLAELCRECENAATAALAATGTRVVPLRLGLVLSKEGGLLARLLPLFRLGLGGRLGNGRQYMSWISLADLRAVVSYVLYDDQVRGPVNAVAPEPVTNRDFTAQLARQLHRPAFLPVPRRLLWLRYGALADEMLLASARVLPERLSQAGFMFQHHELADFLYEEFKPQRRR